MNKIATSYISVGVLQNTVLDILNVVKIIFPRTRPDTDDLPWPDGTTVQEGVFAQR
jgi:hypothetical protein